MTTSLGSLLPRNTVDGGVEVVVIDRNYDEFDPSIYDPLSPSFIIPDWLCEKPTPWNLVEYWQQCLSRLSDNGGPRGLVNGMKAELRPAKRLLDELGLDLAVRVIKYTADTVSVKVTLHRALDRVGDVKRLKQY